MSKTKVLKFYADWCGPCKMYAPIFESVKDAVEGVEFKEVNIDEDTEGLAAEYKVRSIPTTVILKEGEKPEILLGVVAESILKAMVV